METPDREQLKTYGEWAKLGRQVRGGQRANWFLVDEDRAHGIAVFTEDQTEELHEQNLAGFNEIVPRDVWKAPRPPAPRRVRVKPCGVGVAVWCGSITELVAMFKRTPGWYFDRSINRWCHADRTVEQVADVMRDKGFEVVVDG